MKKLVQERECNTKSAARARKIATDAGGRGPLCRRRGAAAVAPQMLILPAGPQTSGSISPEHKRWSETIRPRRRGARRRPSDGGAPDVTLPADLLVRSDRRASSTTHGRRRVARRGEKVA